MIKKIYILLIFFLIIFGFSSCKKEEINYKKEYETFVVKTGSLDIENTFIGNISGELEANLSTKIGGRITYLEKNIGDEVKKGELLLKLDGSEAKNSYNNTSNIINDLKDLKQSTIETFDGQIKVLESKIQQSLIDYNGSIQSIDDITNINDTSIKSQENKIKNAELLLEKAQLNLEEFKKGKIIEKNHILENSKSSIVNSIILYNNIITYIDSILGVTTINKDKNDRFEDYLSVKNSSYLSIGKENFNKSLNNYNEYKKYYEDKIENSLINNIEEKEILLILEKAQITGESIKTLLKNTWNIIDNTVSSVGSISDEEIINYKNEISNFGNNVESSILSTSGNSLLGIQGSIQSIESFKSNYDKSILLLEKEISIAQTNLDGANKTNLEINAKNNGNLTNIKTTSDITKNSIKELYESIEVLKFQKLAKINEIDSQITMSIGNKNIAGINIESGEIFAPFDGIIIDKKGEIGEVVGVGNNVFKIASNLKVKLYLPLVDDFIKKIKIGDEIEVFIEGLDEKFIAKIINIPNSKDSITKKTIIELIIDNNNKKIKIGSIGKVHFLDNSNGIIIPNSSIISDFLIPSVYVLNGNKVELKNIKILEQSNDFSKISGLKVGDIIISSGKENIYNGEILN